MKTRALLEISVETLDAALAAVRGGADRVELCQNLAAGGVTPTGAMMRQARQQIAVPIFVMIRPRAGDFCYSPAELLQMKRQIEQARKARMDGVVFGILAPGGGVDVERNAELVELARPLPVTFHRAFDESKEHGQALWFERLEHVIQTGATRLLTSGGKRTAQDGCPRIARFIGQAGDRITLLPGGAIRPGNLRGIAKKTHATEFHSGLSNLLPVLGSRNQEFEAGVRALARVLQEIAREAGDGGDSGGRRPEGKKKPRTPHNRS
jgi:copper homeostasis protein